MARLQEFTDKDLIDGVDEYYAKCEKDISNQFASVTHMCLKIGISKSQLYKRAGECVELSDSIQRVVSLQEVMLMSNALSKTWDSSMARFLLSANHGMSETIKNDNTNNNLNTNYSDLTPDEQQAIRDSVTKARGQETKSGT